MLWFDVEERYNTTRGTSLRQGYQLWFDVEEGYNTTYRLFVLLGLCCGLISIKDTRRPSFRHTKRGGLFMGIKNGWRDEHGCWPSVGGKMCLKDPVKGLM